MNEAIKILKGKINLCEQIKCWEAGISYESLKIILDCFTQQQKEIDRLRTECGNQSTLWSQHYESIFETVKETLVIEAVEDFIKKLKDIGAYNSAGLVLFTEKDIDNFVKKWESEYKC